jgi:hypothetical protein
MSFSNEDRSFILEGIAERRLLLDQAIRDKTECASALLNLFVKKEMDWQKLHELVSSAKSISREIMRLEDRIGEAEATLESEDQADIQDLQNKILSSMN